MQPITPPLSATAIEAFRRDLRVLEREVVRQMQVETACCGVTLAQCHVLLELQQAGSLSLGELAARQGLDKSTLSRTVDGMVKAGLLHRVVDPDDRRAVSLTSTKTGEARAAAIDDGCNRTYVALFARASAPQRRQIIDTVRFLADAMQRERAAGDKAAAACCAAPRRAAVMRRSARTSAPAAGRRTTRKDT